MELYKGGLGDSGTSTTDLTGLAKTSGGLLPMLSEADPRAQTFGYKADASRVDVTKFPEYSAGQTCATCSIYFGAPEAAAGLCPIFSSKAVAAAGWCTSYTKKP
jgi:hypothetical protein